MHRGKCRRYARWIVCRQNFDYELRYAVARLSRRWTYGRRVVMAFNAGKFEGRGQRYGEERHKSEATTEHWLRVSSHMRGCTACRHSAPSTRRQCHNAIAIAIAMAMQSLHSRFVACQSRQPNQSPSHLSCFLTWRPTDNRLIDATCFAAFCQQCTLLLSLLSLSYQLFVQVALKHIDGGFNHPRWSVAEEKSPDVRLPPPCCLASKLPMDNCTRQKRIRFIAA